MIPRPRPATLVPLGNTDHLLALHGLGDAGRSALVNAIGAWFVSNRELERERLSLLIAEAEAVSS